MRLAAYSPLGSGDAGVLSDPTVVALAAARGRTAAQVLVRWHVQRGGVVLPKSVTPARIASNLEVFDFELSDAEMASLNALECGYRTCIPKNAKTGEVPRDASALEWPWSIEF